MKKKLSRTLLGAIGVFAICIFLGLSILGVVIYYNSVMNKYQMYLEDILQVTLTRIDTDDLDTCIRTREKSPEYEQLKEYLDAVKVNSNIEYIYVVKPVNTDDYDNMQNIILGETEEEKQLYDAIEIGSFTGDSYDSKVAGAFLDCFTNQKETQFFANNTSFGYMYTGMITLRNSKGEEIAVLAADVNMDDVIQTMLFFVVAIIIGGILMTSIFLGLEYFSMSKRIVKPIEAVGKESYAFNQKLAQGIEPQGLDFVRPDIHTGDEIELLTDAVFSMAGELKNYLVNIQTMTTERERLAAELDVAKQIQMNMLPTTFPAFPDRSEFDIYAVIHPVKEGGGNFYDFFMVDAHHIGVVIGDVAGNGVPATIFAVITKTHIKNYSQLGYSPDRVLMETNNQLSYKNDAGLTVSVFLAIVDLRDGRMEYVNAGQMAPLWKHSGEELKFLEAKSCFSLGSMENVPYWKQSIQLTQGDMLFLHTQGVSKTVDEKGNEFTQEYLNELLEQLIQYKYQLPDILDSLQAEQERFAGDAAQPDDSTMVLFRFFGK